MPKKLNNLSKLRRLTKGGDFDGAVTFIENMEKRRQLSPRELVLKARCLQLGTGARGGELEKAEMALKAALVSDDEYVPALIELGWFLYAVSDDAVNGNKLFEKAFKVSLRDCQEALAGLFKTLVETESEPAALDILKNRIRETINSSTILAKARERSDE
jgi:Tfp pilus assembly protein PilF